MNQGENGPVATNTDDGIHINFSEYYDTPEEADYDLFPMKRKRNFASMADQCVEGFNMLLNHHSFAIGLVSLRYDISLPDTDPNYIASEEEFADRAADLFDDEVVARIKAHVAAEYERNEVNVNTDHAAKNEELQFTNEHALTILQWSYACVLVTPLITTYMMEHDFQARESSTLIMDCFGKVLHRFEPEGVDILAKLKKLTESRVLQTRYSDKVMWNYLRNVALEPHIFIDRLFRQFVTDAVPKLKQGTNIIGFFHTFLKNQIKYKFMAKFPLSYKPVRADVMDVDGVSAMDHLETELIRQDEGAATVSEVVCALAMREAMRELRWVPPEAEVRHWASMFQQYGVNAWQRGVVTKYFLPRIRQVQLVKSRTLQDYTTMFLLTRRWLEENEYPALRDYLGARVTEAMNGHKLLSRKKFLRDFMDSAQYRELLGGCYATTSQSIIDSDVVINMISAVHVGNFERIPTCPEEVGQELGRVDHRIETVAQEVLRFINQVVMAD